MTSIHDELAILGGPKAVTLSRSTDWPKVSEREIEAVVALMRQRILSIYDRSGVIAEFEDAFAEYHGVRYALTHNAGTSALHAAFFAAGVGPGDEVIAPTYTFLSTVVPIFQCNANPVLCDLDPEILTISPESIQARITTRTRAIVVTHIWGHPADMDAILALARHHRLPVIEDCSHAHGATYRGRRVGTIGDIGVFSLEGHKPIVAGEGGMLITNNQDYYERAVLLGHFGDRAKECVLLPHNRTFVDTGLGHKYRMHPLAAAIANAQLPHLDECNEMRRRNMEHLSLGLRGIPGIRPPVTQSYATRGGWYGYKTVYEAHELSGLSLDTYLQALTAEGVPVRRPGSPPLHLLPLFQLSGEDGIRFRLPWAFSGMPPRTPNWCGELPNAERMYAKLLSLPTFTDPAEDILDQYALAFAKVAAHADRIRAANLNIQPITDSKWKRLD